MKYFIDLDNTICLNENSDYANSKPILERIRYVNELKTKVIILQFGPQEGLHQE